MIAGKPRTSISIENVFVERGQTLTVYLRKNGFREELDQREVELRSMPDGTLQVFLDNNSIEVKSFEEWSPMEDPQP